MGGPEQCEAQVLDLHFKAISTLLATPEGDVDRASELVSYLSTVVKQKTAKRAKAA
jgi:hypothetical protein